MVFKTSFSIGMDDVDKNLKCKDNIILKYFENAACFHGDSVGQGFGDIKTTGSAWALLEWEIKILNRPSYGQKINVDTWSRSATRTCAYRDYILYADDTPAIYASSKWFRLNLDHRRPERITEEIMLAYGTENNSILGIADIEKIFELEEYSEFAEYVVRKSDIDILGHLHNTRYLDIAYEVLTDKEINNISHIRVSYKKEIPLGEKIIIKKHIIDNKICFAITTNNKNGENVINALIELE